MKSALTMNLRFSVVLRRATPTAVYPYCTQPLQPIAQNIKPLPLLDVLPHCEQALASFAKQTMASNTAWQVAFRVDHWWCTLSTQN
jgi:hypothetical protein